MKRKGMETVKPECWRIESPNSPKIEADRENLTNLLLYKQCLSFIMEISNMSRKQKKLHILQ